MSQTKFDEFLAKAGSVQSMSGDVCCGAVKGSVKTMSGDISHQ